MKHLLFMSAIVFSFLGSCAQQPPASPKATAEGKGVKVTYGQPSKKRVVKFSVNSYHMEKYGELEQMRQLKLLLIRMLLLVANL